MAAHRYWRINTISVPDASYLEISEWHLYNGASRVDASATISASDTVAGGALANLQDNDTGTLAYWLSSVVEDPDFWIKWDFGTAQNVDGSKFAGHDTATRYPSGFTLQWSDDNSSWTTQNSVSGIAYPGNLTFTEIILLSEPKTVAGVVKDASGTPISGRTVRVYKRADGSLLGETTSATTTGAFSFTVSYDAAVYVIVLDADGGSANALIFDRVIPV